MSIPKCVTNGKNPTHLPARYEIRQLTIDHIPWVIAIVMHTNVFHSPVWPVIYPDAKTKRLRRGALASDYLICHQVESGMSFGIFDKGYQYKRPESAATQGKLYWDQDDLESDGPALLEQMDFPLVSVALAYDGNKPLDLPSLMPLFDVLPLFPMIYHILEGLDKRNPESWKPQRPHDVLMRNAASTRADYEGQGLMKKLAQWLMREAALEGYRGIQIECGHDAVTHTWLHPPKPFEGDLVAKFDMGTYEQENEDGTKTRLFEPAKQVCTKIYVTL